VIGMKQSLIGVTGALIGLCSFGFAEPVGYQGRLDVNSVPAEGVFDLQCVLFDAPIDGNQIGELAVVDDLMITDGLLNTQLDFGDAFDSAGVYLEISIRDGASEGEYEVLTPRQFIASTPKAIHALSADSIRGLGWTPGESLFTTGDLLTFGEGNDRVLINRDELVNPLEFFGVHINGLDIGAMVISNEEAMKSTMFAHVTGGVIGASEVFNGTTRELTLQIDAADVLKANSAGIQSVSYKYLNPTTGEIMPVAGAVTVAGDVFHSAMGTPFLASVFSGGAYITDANMGVPMVAPIQLPNGATVTKFTARFEDAAVSDLLISIKGASANGTLLGIADIATSGSAAGIQSLSTTEIVAENSVIENGTTGYYIRAFSPSWPGDSTLRIWSVTVEYTVDGPS
jgi:hypothetical protein